MLSLLPFSLHRTSHRRLRVVTRSLLLTLVILGSLSFSRVTVASDPVITVPTAEQQKVIDENKKKDQAAFTPEVPLPGVFEGKQAGDETLLAKYISAIYIYFIWAVGAVAVVMVMYGGLRWVGAAGNPGQIKEARDIIDNAVIGILIALSSVVLLNIINPKLTQLQLPGVKQVKKETACLKKTFTNVNVCKGKDFVPCGETRSRTEKDPDTGQNINYTCFGTLCKTKNNIKSVCMMVDSADGYGTPTCVTSIPAENTDDKCNVTATSTIPVTSQVTTLAYTWNGVIQVGSGGLGTEYTVNDCSMPDNGVGISLQLHSAPNAFIVGKPKAQILLPVAGAAVNSPDAHSRLNGRGCPLWEDDTKMSDILLK